LKVCWVLESGGNSEKFHRCCPPEKKEKSLHENPVEAELVETQKEQRAPRIPATFENQQKVSWTSLVFQFLKIGPSSRVGLAETVQSTHWKKIPTHEMIHRFSTPVQSKSNRTHKILPKPTENQCCSRKTLVSILKKISIKTCLILRNFCRKNTGFSWMTQRLIKIFRIVR
jgi:hypothetical protein